MNEREIAEIRRRMRPEKNNIGRIRGCYVNENKSIISEFNQNFSLISNDESEEILSTVRKVFSGTIGRNLIDISFSNQQVLDSDEHRLLSALRNTSLADDEAVKTLFNKVITSLEIDSSYLILLISDKYDIFTYDENGERNDSTEMFSYVVCAICPIKAGKPALGYNISENKFKNIIRDSMICPPSIGFMFPSFESKGANIYNALYYTHDVSNSHEEFTTAVFNTAIPLPADEQKASIAGILSDTVADSCSLELIQSLQGQLIELSTDHKANKEETPLMLSAKDVGSLLRSGGVNESTVSDFSDKLDKDLGEFAAIPPENIMDIKKFEVKTPSVTVKVAPENSDLIETRVIDGSKYLLIRADGDIEVNGIRVNIND